MRSGDGRPSFGLPGRRHQSVRDAQDHAGLSAAHIRELPYVYVNGGKRGYLVGIKPDDIVRVLRPVEVDVTA